MDKGGTSAFERRSSFVLRSSSLGNIYRPDCQPALNPQQVDCLPRGIRGICGICGGIPLSRLMQDIISPPGSTVEQDWTLTTLPARSRRRSTFL